MFGGCFFTSQNTQNLSYLNRLFKFLKIIANELIKSDFSQNLVFVISSLYLRANIADLQKKAEERESSNTDILIKKGNFW